MSAFQFLQETTRGMARQREELENLRVLQNFILLRLMAYPDECFDVALPPAMFIPHRWTRTWDGQIWLNQTDSQSQGWLQLYYWTESFRIRYDLKIATVIAHTTLWVFNPDNFVRPEMVDSEERLAGGLAALESFKEPNQSGTPRDRAVAKYEASRLMNEVMGLAKPRPKTAPGR